MDEKLNDREALIKLSAGWATFLDSAIDDDAFWYLGGINALTKFLHLLERSEENCYE